MPQTLRVDLAIRGHVTSKVSNSCTCNDEHNLIPWSSMISSTCMASLEEQGRLHVVVQSKEDWHGRGRRFRSALPYSESCASVMVTCDDQRQEDTNVCRRDPGCGRLGTWSATTHYVPFAGLCLSPGGDLALSLHFMFDVDFAKRYSSFVLSFGSLATPPRA
jgi:hypothetical protein